jgi:hypothetical protein
VNADRRSQLARALPALVLHATVFASVFTPEVRAQEEAIDSIAGLPEWVRSLERLRVYGDFRLRQEADRELDGRDDRNRTRLRLRVGANYEIDDELLVGTRIVTGHRNDPNSSHITLGDAFDDLELSLDRAFLEYRPEALGGTSLTAGKFAHPFWLNPVYGELVWDADVQPEGIVARYRSPLAGFDAVEASLGGYIVNEEAGEDDVYALVAQVHLRDELASGVRGDLAVGYYNYSDVTPGGEADLIADNRGNALEDKDGDGEPDDYASSFGILNPIASLTIERGERPLVFSAEYIENFRADIDDDTGWAVGVSYGMAAKRGEWRAYYQWQEVQRDSVFSPFAQDDFLLATNHKSHVAGVRYALTDSVGLHLWGLVSARDDTSSGSTTDSDDDQWRLRLDIDVKF